MSLSDEQIEKLEAYKQKALEETESKIKDSFSESELKLIALSKESPEALTNE